MTLIAAAIHKHGALISTDTRLTENGTGVSVNENTGKSAFLDCGDGRVLVGFTGLAEINNLGTIDFIIHKLSDIDLSSKSITEVTEKIQNELSQSFRFIFGGHKVPALVIVFAGWQNGEARHPRVFKISNITHYEGGIACADVEFHVHTAEILPDRTLLVIDGDLRATSSKPFKTQQKKIGKILRRHTNKLDETTMRELAKLIDIASTDQASTTINDRIMVSRLKRNGGGIEYKFFPESSDYILPSFVNENIAVTGLTVRNDPIVGGNTVVGGNGSNFPFRTDEK